MADRNALVKRGQCRRKGAGMPPWAGMPALGSFSRLKLIKK
jgi:hypothetical protein